MSDQPASPGDAADPPVDGDPTDAGNGPAESGNGPASEDEGEILFADPDDNPTSGPPDLRTAGPPDSGPEEETVEVLRAKLAEVKQRAADTHDRLLRKAAELENIKRRLTKQMDDTRKYASEEGAKEMLPVLDDLELAIEHAKSSEGDGALETFLDGVNLVRRKFQGVLERQGIASFESIGKPFDPKVHEAISQQETAAFPEGHVAGEYLKGYMIHDRLLRPALVIVAKNPSGETPEG